MLKQRCPMCANCINFIPVKTKKRNVVKSNSIAEELGIWECDSYDEISAAKKAWITIKAKKAGKNPVMVHAGIKAHFNKA